MIKNFNKTAGILLLCLHVSLLNAMVPPPEITKSYRDWLTVGNKGTMWNFIQQQMQGPAGLQAELKQDQDQIAELKNQLQEQKKQVKEQKPLIDQDKQKLEQDLAKTKTQLASVRTELESARALLGQREKTFATKTGETESLSKASQVEIARLQAEIVYQRANFDSEKQRLLSQLNENINQRNNLINQQALALAQKDKEVFGQIQKTKTDYENVKKEQERLAEELKKQQEALEKEKMNKKNLEISLQQQAFVKLAKQKEESDKILTEMQKEKQQLLRQLYQFRAEKQKIDMVEVEKQKEAEHKKMVQAVFWGELNDSLKQGQDNINTFMAICNPLREPFKELFGKKDLDGQNVFHYVARFGAIQILNDLIKRALLDKISLGQYFNSQDKEGNTVLHNVLYNLGSNNKQNEKLFIDMARMLLKNGASAFVVNKIKESPFDIAITLELQKKLPELFEQI